MEFLYIKGSSEKDVRLAKYVANLTRLGHKVNFIGWNRYKKDIPDSRLQSCLYLIQGGGAGRKSAIYYPVWMCKLFWVILFRKDLKNKIIVAVNFDAAMPVMLACIVRRKKFIYEIYDEFALSYHFPRLLVAILRMLDRWIIKRATMVVHVDQNRVHNAEPNYIVLENAPDDYWNGVKTRVYDKVRLRFAVTGCLSQGRGMRHICDFAKSNPNVEILAVGRFLDDATSAMVRSVPNITHFDYMPQKKLFELMKDCCAIFSLYDPSLEINRLAASNKVYDAMMMGIPVITNKEVINSKFIEDSNVGMVVDYEFNKTWNLLASHEFLSKAIIIGQNGRKLYLAKYQFSKMIENRYLPRVCKL